MKILKKLLKLPAVCVSVAGFLAFMIVLIVTCTNTYSTGTYRYKSSSDGGFNPTKMVVELTLNDDETGYVELTIIENGRMVTEEGHIYYKIIDGAIYVTDTFPTDTPVDLTDIEYVFFGNINAFEIQKGDISLTNNTAQTLKVVSIVFMCLFLACTVASTIYTCWDGKNQSPKETIEETIE